MILNSMIDVIGCVWYKAIFSLLNGENRNNFLRRRGIKIGKGCKIYASEFSTEPFLIELRDNVTIAPGSFFITHDGAIEMMRDINPEVDLFGKIVIGANSIIGSHCIILPNTEVGDNCIVGAGSVVRGKIPNDSVVIGNPAKIVMKTSLAKKMLKNHKNCLKTKLLNKNEKMNMVREHFNIS